MRSVAITVLLLAVVTLSAAQPLTVPFKPSVCFANSSALVGNATFSAVNGSNGVKSQRDCFYTCTLYASQFYTYTYASRSCQCFQRANITSALWSPGSVYGNVKACINFCSVPVGSSAKPNCKRCGQRNCNPFLKNCPPSPKGLFCLPGSFRSGVPELTRCCCNPPSRVYIRKGKIIGCSKYDKNSLASKNEFSAAGLINLIVDYGTKV